MKPILVKGVLFLENARLYVKYEGGLGRSYTARVDDRALSAELAELKQRSIYHFQTPIPVALEFTTLGSNASPSKVERFADQAVMDTSTRPAPPPPSRDSSEERTAPGDFHNAYSFVPRPPRVTDDDDLGDHSPDVSLGVFAPGRWTGTIHLKMTTASPLLISDAQSVRTLSGLPIDDPKAHKIYPVRVDAAGMPYLPPTSLKGALRSAYEIITNSRFGVFSSHDVLLAYRAPASGDTLDLIPARIEEDDGRLFVHLLTGSTTLEEDGSPREPNRRFATIRAYSKHSGTEPLRDSRIGTLRHGQEVRALIKLAKGSWSVIDIKRADEQRLLTGSTAGTREVLGWLSLANKSIDGKVNEQVFFSTAPDDRAVRAPLTSEVAERWGVLVGNYQDEHADEIARGETGPSTLKHSEWSRHITDSRARELKHGDLCYARVSMSDGKPVVDELIPVMVSRQLYDKAPSECLHPSLAPAKSLGELSPADRLFGWVNPSGHGAVRGRVRIGRIRCTAASADDAVERFSDDGVPLTILAQPKPQQERFYAARGAYGTPLARHARRGTGYRGDDAGLRGQKVYPHHRGVPEGYWDEPEKDRTRSASASGWAQEYRRPDTTKGLRSAQNRSVTSWVKAGVSFECDVFIQNLSDFELGALLWLFGMPEDHFFRVGGGKPLGFGSLRVEWQPSESGLRTGESWADHWRSLGAVSGERLDQEAAQALAQSFETRVRSEYSQAIEYHADFLRAFLRAAKGHEDGKPVHYPRARPGAEYVEGPLCQDPEGESFKWFVANERPAHQFALPPLAEDKGLPYLPADSNTRNRGR